MKKISSYITCMCICAALVVCASDYIIKNTADAFILPAAASSEEIELTGPWEFYWQRFINPLNTLETPDKIVQVPYLWTDFSPNGTGYASYRLRISGMKQSYAYSMYMFDKVGTACRIFINGQLAGQIGTPSQDYTKTASDQQMVLIPMESDKYGNMEIVIHASNDFHRKGGIWGKLFIAEQAVAEKVFNDQLDERFLFIGAILVILIYHFSYFLFRKYNWASFFLTFFTLAIFIRIAVQGFSVLNIYFPSVPYAIRLKLEYTALFACPLFFALYLKSIYTPVGKIAFFFKAIVTVGILFALLIYGLPIRWANRLVIPCEIYLLISGVYLIGVLLYYSIMQKNLSSFMNLMSTFLLILCTVHDIMVLQMLPTILPYTYILPYGFIAFFVLQSVITAWQREQSEHSISVLTEDLVRTNSAYYRFVPKEFLALLNKKNIIDVGLGDWTAGEMALLCADIRNFTTISENMSGKEVFGLLNRYLVRIAPIIRDCGGFIEKYLGDGIIALFPTSADVGHTVYSACECALFMQNEMNLLNEDLSAEGYPPIKIGIGLHYGKVVLGTIGEHGRMNGIAVSKAVETVMSLESLTKVCTVPILMSSAIIKKGQCEDDFLVKKIDCVYTQTKIFKDDIYALVGFKNEKTAMSLEK